LTEKKKILIRDLTLRDGHQSLFATRMTQAQIDRVLPMYRDAGFYALEVWGGAVPDSVMRFLDESPWERLERIKAGIGGAAKLTALSRGRNLFGYTPYPDAIIEGFCRHAVGSGIDIMRIFDALNDIDNVASTVRFTKKHGATADCAICYTVDPPAGLLPAGPGGEGGGAGLFTTDYFVGKAREMERLGADMITVKDMAGLITPGVAAGLVEALKKGVGVPVDVHTHCTPGFGLAAVLMAMIRGADIIDTVVLNFSGGPAGPAFELLQVFAGKLGIDTGVNLEAVGAINRELGAIRKELARFDESKDRVPPDFDISRPSLPRGVEALFDDAIERALADDMDALLDAVHRIEGRFNLPEPNEPVRAAQIPGGMYSNMLVQMKQLQIGHLFDRVLEIVPRVRVDAGCPPLVTPTSQIVGAQAVACVLDEARGAPIYTTRSDNFTSLVRGTYGKTPVPIDPAFREKITGAREEVAFDTGAYREEENPVLAELGGVRLAADEKEKLLLDLFPGVAAEFLARVRAREHRAAPAGREPTEFEEWESMALSMC